jgi:hypothetical protein
MYYSEGIKELINDRKNPVNRMYLHEIMLKWQSFEKKAEKFNDVSNENLVKSLNTFISAISNNKYKYNTSTKNGFKPDSPIYATAYLDDLLTVFIKRTEIYTNVGISWGYQAFSTELKFNPANLCSMSDHPKFEYYSSTKILHLAQKLDFQFRVTGKRRFNKHQLVLPLILFFTYQNLTEKDYITIEYYANQAKATFEKSKAIIVTETLDDEFKPDISNSPFNSIFILRKQYKSARNNSIQLDVVNKLEKRIKAYCTESTNNGYNFFKSGVIDSFSGR